MSQTENIAERVFRPGNLVHALTSDGFGRSLSTGIRTGHPLDPRAERWICTAMLSNRRLPGRYTVCGHRGPKEEDYKGGTIISVILSKDKVLKAFPNRVFAIGDFFWRKDLDYPGLRTFKSHYQFSEDGNCVYGIPTKNPSGEPSWPDEVRIYPEDPATAEITPEMWDGIVMRRATFESFERLPKLGINLDIDIPIFDTQCQLIRG